MTISHPLTHHPLFLPKSLSVLYSPHGLPASIIRPYATTHLLPSGALPLTLLLHAFDSVQNPWYLGGNIIAGMPGGVEIAKQLCARAWVSAHDEEKESGGWSVKDVVTKRWSVEEVRRAVLGGAKNGKNDLEVRQLVGGEEMTLTL
jgi:hypothetical protein